jgi:uncharacterized cupin superfamily protein
MLAGMSKPAPHVVNVDEVEETGQASGDHWGGFDKCLTPSMRARGGSLGINHSRVRPGHTMSPFHYHQREDEAFFVLSGRGVLRYGDELSLLRAGDCVSCPAGTKIAHQIANPFEEDLIYLAIGVHDPHEVCVYPDNGKVMIRSLRQIGFMNPASYLEGEPERPKIFELAAALLSSNSATR